MLTKRIIPCLDVDRGRVVKGVRFLELRDAGDPVDLAEFYNREGADELVFLDITASSEARGIMVEVVERVSDKVFIPLTVGGGLREVADVRIMLESGADKVSLNTAAVQDPQLIYKAAKFFGSQCIVVAIDVKSVGDVDTGISRKAKLNWDTRDLLINQDSKWEVYTHGGRVSTGIDALRWIERIQELGAGELLVTSMDTDGGRSGYDLALLSGISELVTVPLIASGGAGSLDHMVQAVRIGKADGLLAASIFHFGDYTVAKAKEYLAEQGIPIRPIQKD